MFRKHVPPIRNFASGTKKNGTSPRGDFKVSSSGFLLTFLKYYIKKLHNSKRTNFTLLLAINFTSQNASTKL
jgi:hypothetical protein